MDQVLTRQQAELVALERRLVLHVRDALSQADGPRADLERLAQLVTEMDELFLLVVAGEYNAGKSTFINALLGDEVFAMGDLPTTRLISILRFGEPGTPEPALQCDELGLLAGQYLVHVAGQRTRCAAAEFGGRAAWRKRES